MQKNSSAKRITPAKKSIRSDKNSPSGTTQVHSGRHHCKVCHKKRLDKFLRIVFHNPAISHKVIRACEGECQTKAERKIEESHNWKSSLGITSLPY